MGEPWSRIAGAIEAGGIKTACAFGHGPGAGILARAQDAPSGQ